MATISELGQKVKAKYPQYADMDDREVGRLVKSKYPSQYADFSDDAPTKQTTKPTAKPGKLGDLAGGALYSFSAPGRNIQNLLSKGVEKLTGAKDFGRATQQGFERATGTNLDTRAGKIGQFGGEVASYAIPGAGAAKATLKAPTLAKMAAGGLSDMATQISREGVSGDTATTGALGTLLPGVGAKAPAALRQMQSLMTNVPRETIDRVKNPVLTERITQAMTQVRENAERPYFQLSESVLDRANAVKEDATNALQGAIGSFVQRAPQNIDVRPQVNVLRDAVKKFRTSGLLAEESRNLGQNIDDFFERNKSLSPDKLLEKFDEEGLSNIRIRTTQQGSQNYSQKELTELNKLLSNIQLSGNISPADVLALRQSFSSAYDAIPQVSTKSGPKPKPYHAVVMSMKEAFDEATEKLLPKELRSAYRQYADAERMADELTGAIVDAKGQKKKGAEQFLSNISNLNKGEQAELAKKWSKLLGMDLVEESKIIKDAIKLTEPFSRTGSRVRDVLLSGGGMAIGSVLGNFPGAAIGGLGTAAATSPAILGATVKRTAPAVNKLRSLRNRTGLQGLPLPRAILQSMEKQDM